MKDEDMENIKKEALQMTFLEIKKFLKDLLSVSIYFIGMLICIAIMIYCLYEATFNQSYIPSLIFLFIYFWVLVVNAVHKLYKRSCVKIIKKIKIQKKLNRIII